MTRPMSSSPDLMCTVPQDGCTPARIRTRARRCDLPTTPTDEAITRGEWEKEIAS